jgi:cell division septation protein DedD
VNETRPRASSSGAAGPQRPVDPVDDWLGDVSDDDWSAPDAVPSGSRSVPPATREAFATEDEPQVGGPAERSERARAAPGRGGVDFGRRRAVAGLVLVAIVGVAAAFAVVLLRGGDEEPKTAVTAPVTTPSPSETEPSPTTTTPTITEPTTTEPTTTEPTTTEPTTTEPSTNGTDAFTLPEGTKLQLGGENDPAVVTDLQEALTAAGYNPGAADGTFGEQTESAVVAFQEANGLAVDGRVGPETAAALNAALAEG